MRLTHPAARAGRAAARGMTLIELMIGLAIAAILLLLAAPAYRDFIANTNVRNAAENTVAGLRQARAEAVKRNAYTKFTLSNDGWSIDEIDIDGTVISSLATYEFSEGAKKAKIDSLNNRVVVCFTGMGRVDQDRNNDRGCDDTKQIVDIQFSSDMIADPKIWHAIVGNANSGIRLCTNNPTLRAAEPDDASLCPLDNPDR